MSYLVIDKDPRSISKATKLIYIPTNTYRKYCIVLYCIVLYDEGQSKPISNAASERHSSEGF